MAKGKRNCRPSPSLFNKSSKWMERGVCLLREAKGNSQYANKHRRVSDVHWRMYFITTLRNLKRKNMLKARKLEVRACSKSILGNVVREAALETVHAHFQFLQNLPTPKHLIILNAFVSFFFFIMLQKITSWSSTTSLNIIQIQTYSNWYKNLSFIFRQFFERASKAKSQKQKQT